MNEKEELNQTSSLNKQDDTGSFDLPLETASQESVNFTQQRDSLQPNLLSNRKPLGKKSLNNIDNNQQQPLRIYTLPTSTHLSMTKTPENKELKPTFTQKMMSKLPTLPQIRKTLKASIALLIALVFVFDMTLREAIGNSILLHAIATIFFFPVRTIGIQLEAIVLGVGGGLIATAWSFLGGYLASLARNKSDPNPVQPGACAILAVFLFFGSFILNLIRIQIPKANFACVIACILLSFTLTYQAGYRDFTTEIGWLFLKPIASAGAVCLGVNLFIWPDDSITNFLELSKKMLNGYNAFFKEHSDAFILPPSLNSNNSTLPILKARLNNGILVLIESKNAVKREILYSRVSDVDCGELTNLISEMRHALHGLGLSLILKNEYVNEESENIFFKKFHDERIMNAFNTSIHELNSSSRELIDMCYIAIAQTSTRLGNLHYHPRTNLNSILWPFPRLWVSKPKNSTSIDTNYITSSQLKKTMALFDDITKKENTFQNFLEMNSADIPRNGPLYLIFLYIYNIKQHAKNVIKLVETVEKIEKNSTKPKLWLPHQTLKKWLVSGNDVGENIVEGQESQFEVQNGGNDLVRIATQVDENRDKNDYENSNYFETGPYSRNGDKLGDPDVSAPVTLSHKFFYVLYIIGRWFTKTNTVFALKTAIGVVMLAIPAYRPQDHEWFIEWRAQWTMITLVLWMFPITGAFIIGIAYRITGSVIGSVLGIVVWEICRGNPYGLSVLCFAIFIPFYYMFFYVHTCRVIALMTKITMLLVIVYEYNYVVEDIPNHDEVYTVAGKRLLMVVIGIVASAILIAIPYVTTGRVSLRKKISNTIRDIGKCFGILSAAVTTKNIRKAPPAVVKSFQKLTLSLRRQIAEEHGLLDMTRYEPPLRGYFPRSSYKLLLEKIDNMSDLVANMGHSLYDVRPEWRTHIASILLRERREYLAYILTTLKLLSSTLAAKTALPPYMISPVELRQRFINLLEKKIIIDTSDISDPSFPSYSAYLINSLVFVDELQHVLRVVEDLVGVEDPENWLLTKI